MSTKEELKAIDVKVKIGDTEISKATEEEEKLALACELMPDDIIQLEDFTLGALYPRDKVYQRRADGIRAGNIFENCLRMIFHKIAEKK